MRCSSRKFELLLPIVTYSPKQPEEGDTFYKISKFLKSVSLLTHRGCVNYLNKVLGGAYFLCSAQEAFSRRTWCPFFAFKFEQVAVWIETPRLTVM